MPSDNTEGSGRGGKRLRETEHTGDSGARSTRTRVQTPRVTPPSLLAKSAPAGLVYSGTVADVFVRALREAWKLGQFERKHISKLACSSKF